jgi:tetratricopeptide (TPR) repeat protein
MVRAVFSYWSHKAAVILLLLISLGLTQVPLFNYLGYEFSVSIALVWSLAAGLLTISLWNKSSGPAQPEARPFLVQSIALALVPLFVPFIVMTLNAFVVKNCSFIQGAILFLLIVIPAVLFANAFSFLIVMSLKRWKKTIFVLSWLLILSQIAYVTLTRPQIFAFNPVLGFFAGLTYDETLEVVDRLILYRIGTLAFSAFLILEAIAIRKRRMGDVVDAPTGKSNSTQYISLALLVATGLLYVFSDRLGLSSSESSIERSLGGKTETEHFVISYPDSSLKGLRLQQVALLHEFYYDQLVRALRVRPAKKIHTFLYASSDQKGRLIGAAATNFAKPWLSQLHMNLGDLDGSLKHELVHVLAAEFGFPLLRVGVNSGLIEGLAVAVERMEYEEPINRLAGMAFAAGNAPDVSSLFSLSGFMKAPAGVSYTLAGSFCRFLIDRYGMRRFKVLYSTGEFETLYGRSLQVLLQEWRRTMTAFRFGDADLAKAEYLFKRRSIFGKECARVIANLNKETRGLLAQRKFVEALASADKSLGHTVSADAVYQKSAALLRLGMFPEAIAFTEGQLRDSIAGPSFLTLKLSLGDALWGVDSLESAMKVYSELLRSHLSSGWDETLALRLEILLNPDLARELKSYFLDSSEDSVRVQALEKLAVQHPKEPIVKYLLAREKILKEQYEDAVQLLDGIPPWRTPVLELARQRRLGQLSFAIGKYEKAKIYYWQSLNHLYRDVHSVEIEEKIRLCDWVESFRTRFN